MLFDTILLLLLHLLLQMKMEEKPNQTTSSLSGPTPAQSGILQGFSPDLVKLVSSRSLDILPASLFKNVFQSIWSLCARHNQHVSGKVLLKKPKSDSLLSS